MDFIYDAYTVYTRRFVCGRYPHKINSKFIVYTHTLHIYKYNKYNIIVIINGGKMMIGSIDECTIIEISVNLKNIKKKCYLYIYSVFYVYTIKIQLNKKCRLLILNKINMSYTSNICHIYRFLWLYNELNDLKLIINRIEREKGNTILCNCSTISIK